MNRLLLNVSILTIIVCFLWLLFASTNVRSFTPEEEGVLNKAQKSLSQNTEENIEPTLLESDYKSYKNLDYNVKIQYPADWSFKETGYDEISPDTVFKVTFNSPFEVASDIVLFSISIANLKPSDTTLQQYEDRIRHNVNDYQDFKDVVISDATLDGNPAFRIEYTVWTFEPVEKSIDITSVNNGRVQEVSAFGEQPAIDKYSEEITNMIKSVKFGEPSTNIGQSPQKTSKSDVVLESVSETDEQNNCDASYPDFCIPPPPPNLNCPDISQKRFTVTGFDPHGFDRDNDGVGCES